LKSDKIGAQRSAFVLRNHSKKDFSASPPVVNEVVLSGRKAKCGIAKCGPKRVFC
jgi:hypothetical protein